MSLSPCSTDPCSLWYAVQPSVFSPLSLLGNSLSTDSASLAQSQENSPEDETEATQGEFFFFLFRFSCIQWNVYIFMYTINILLQTRELGDCTDMAQSLLSHFVLEEIHFLLFHTVLDKDKALHEWQIQGSEFLISWVLWKSNYLSRSLIVCLVVNSSMSWNCHLIGHEAQAMSEETPKVAMVRAFCPQLCNSALRKHPYVPVRPSKSRNKSASPTHLWSWPG